MINFFPKGGIPKLVRLASVPQLPVRIEAIAALANLAVNGKFKYITANTRHTLSFISQDLFVNLSM